MSFTTDMVDPRACNAWMHNKRFCEAHYPFWFGARKQARSVIKPISEYFGSTHTLVMAHQIRVVLYRHDLRYDMNQIVESPDELAQRWGLIRSSVGHYYLFKTEEDAVIASLLV